MLYHECLTLQLVDVTIRFMEITCKNNEKECTIIGQNTFEIEKNEWFTIFKNNARGTLTGY